MCIQTNNFVQRNYTLRQNEYKFWNGKLKLNGNLTWCLFAQILIGIEGIILLALAETIQMEFIESKVKYRRQSKDK